VEYFQSHLRRTTKHTGLALWSSRWLRSTKLINVGPG